MSLASPITSWLLQAATLPDTIVAKTMPAQHTWFDYTTGTLQLVVLVLAVFVLFGLVLVLLGLRKMVETLHSKVDSFSEDVRPILAQAREVAADAREVVAMIRTDAERVTEAAGAVSEQLLNVAATTERRMDDINAVIDVVQGELEETVLSTTAALRGARLGGSAIARALIPRSGKKKRRNRSDRRDDAHDRG